MRPLKMTLNGFMSFRYETTVDFEGLSMVAVTGKNGNGKSSIILGVAWILFGETRLPSDKDSIIHDLEEEAHGQLDLEASDGTRWRIVRSRWYQGSSELKLYSWSEAENNWLQFGDHRIATNQEQIDRIVGMDIDAFYSLMVIQQSMVGGTRFTGADSNQRRAILMGLLPELAVWADIEQESVEYAQKINKSVESLEERKENLGTTIERSEAAHESLVSQLEENDVNGLHEQITRLTSERDSVQARIDAEDSGIGDLQARLKTIRAERAAHNSDTRAQISETRAEIQKIESEIKQSELLENEIKTLEESLPQKQADLERLIAARPDPKSIEADEETLQGYREKLSRVRDKLSALKQQRNDLESRHDAMQLQLDDGEEGHCIVCESPLSSDKMKQLHEDVLEELETVDEQIERKQESEKSGMAAIARAEKRIKDARKQIEEASRSIDSAQFRLESDKSELETLKQKMLDEDPKAIGQKKAKIKRLETKMTKLNDALRLDESDEESELDQKITEAQQKSQGHRELVEIDRKITAANRVLAEAHQIQGRVEAEADRVKELKKELAEVEADLSQGYVNQDTATFVRAACNPKGVPSMLIGDVLDAIEDEQNSILDRLMGDRAMHVNFKQDKELKSREGTKAALDIVVQTPDDWTRPIESFSGGEQVRLSLSNLFAMLSVFNARHPGMVSTLWLDEPFGPIDDESIPIMVDIIRDAIQNGIVTSVFVVTHDPRVIDMLPQRMIVSRDATRDYTTTVEVA